MAIPVIPLEFLAFLAGWDSTNCGLGFCNQAFLQRIVHLNEKKIGCLRSFTTPFLFRTRPPGAGPIVGAAGGWPNALGIRQNPFRSRDIAALAVQPGKRVRATLLIGIRSKVHSKIEKTRFYSKSYRRVKFLLGNGNNEFKIGLVVEVEIFVYPAALKVGGEM
jgi:hypothetical protein